MSIQVFHRCRVHQVDYGDLIRCSCGCWERFPFLFFVRTAPGVQLWIWPPSACRSPEGICSSLRQDGVKGAADPGTLAHSGWGEGGVRMPDKPAWRCTGLRCTMCSPREVVPGSRDPGSGGLHRLPGGEVWIVTCARTQASWWQQQQS